MTITATPLPTVRLIRVRFFEDDVYEGTIPRECYENAVVEDFDFDPETDFPVEDAVRVLVREGLSFAATGTDWAADPDGSCIIDYARGRREETTGHLVGFTPAQVAAITEAVG